MKYLLLVTALLLTGCDWFGGGGGGGDSTPAMPIAEEPIIEEHEPDLANCASFQLDNQPKTIISGIYPPNGFLILETYGSPYRIDGSIQIPDGYKLTVMPGVEIQCGKIEVFGTLHISGREDNPVILNDVTVSAPYKPEAGNDLLKASLTTIKYTHFYGNNSRLYSSSNRLTVEDSIFQNSGDFAFIPHDYSNIIIERNIFLNSAGIRVSTKFFSGHAIIRNNYFYNQRGFGHDGDDIFAVQSSDDYGHQPTIVEYNSFVSTNLVAVKFWEHGDSTLNMTAYNNYWGTIDNIIIEQMIYDANDDPLLNLYIPYNPYLLQHHPNTPIPSDENNDGIPDIVNELYLDN